MIPNYTRDYAVFKIFSLSDSPKATKKAHIMTVISSTRVFLIELRLFFGVDSTRHRRQHLPKL